MNIRAVYGTPCWSQYFSKRSNVSGTVNVRVRHVTTMGANKVILHPLTQFMAYRARLARVCRVHVIHGYSNALRLVGHKVLQLTPRPAVQPRPNSIACLDPVTDTGQVFEPDFAGTTRYGLSHNGLGDTVIHMRDVTTFLARDFPKALLCALGTVGLETPPMGQVLVPVISQFSTIKHSTAGSGRDVILTNINPHNLASRNWRWIGHIKDKIEKPLSFFANQLRFGGRALVEKVLLVLTHDERHDYSTVQGEKRKFIFLGRVGSFVKMHGLRTELNQGDRLAFFDSLVCLKGFIGRSYFVNGVTRHLRSKLWESFSNLIIGKVMKGYSVPAAMISGVRDHYIARSRKGISQVSEGLGLFCGVQ